MSSRWLRFILVILIGMAAGLYYGWVIDPVQYVDTDLSELSPDYKTDYVLMTAEAYSAEQDLDLAAQRLSALNGASPQAIIQEAVLFAENPGYTDTDRALLQDLNQAFQDANAGENRPGS
jgi:hypothetical protein